MSECAYALGKTISICTKLVVMVKYCCCRGFISEVSTLENRVFYAS